MARNILWRTRTYLVGHMQYVTDTKGQGWRDKITHELKKMGVVVFNPYRKPFIEDVQEGVRGRQIIQGLRDSGDYDAIHDRMKKIRAYDLSLIDRSDFIVAHILPTVASWGSAEEISVAVHLKRPIFISIEGGKKLCPSWIFGMLPHKYIYDSPEDILAMLQNINTGRVAIDSDRWKLFKRSWR